MRKTPHPDDRQTLAGFVVLSVAIGLAGHLAWRLGDPSSHVPLLVLATATTAARLQCVAHTRQCRSWRVTAGLRCTNPAPGIFIRCYTPEHTGWTAHDALGLLAGAVMFANGAQTFAWLLTRTPAALGA